MDDLIDMEMDDMDDLMAFMDGAAVAHIGPQPPPPEQRNRENLPVAVPVPMDHRLQMLRERRRHFLTHRFRRRVHRPGVAAAQAQAAAVPLPQQHGQEAQPQQQHQLHQAALLMADAVVVSSFLYDLIGEDLPCCAVLSGTHVRGCTCIVERIQEHPEEVRFQCPRTGRSPLHEATLRGGCPHVIKALLEAVPSQLLQVDARQNTPLHCLFLGITNQTQEEVLELLLAPAMDQWLWSMRNMQGNLALHCACAAPLSPSLRTMERLLEASPAAASRTNHLEQTPLHLHALRRNASTEIAQLLLTAFPEALQARDRTAGAGFTPLHYAAQQSNHALLQLLARADPTAAALGTVSSSLTALHLLCQQNPRTDQDMESLQCLLEVAPSAATRQEQGSLGTPLHWLCRGTRVIDLRAVQLLLSALSASTVLTLRDAAQYIPLHYACEHGADPAVISALLQACPEAASIRTRKNDTPLSLACAANHKSLETVQLLLKAYPDAVLQPNDYGFLPLHVACRAYHANTSVVKALVEACPEAVLKTTHAGETVLHLTSNNAGASIGVLDVLQRTVRQQQQQEQLGALLPSTKNTSLSSQKTLSSTSAGNTPLHVACFRDSSRPHIESLAASNPEWITVRNNAGYSPLQILCKNGRIDDRIVTLFSRLCGPEIFSSVDLMGNTPLHSAMREETDVQVLRAIIRAYPDALHMKTSYDDTPLHLACLRKVRPEVVREVVLASSVGLETAMANCNGRISPILIRNSAGQTPIGICMEEYQRQCRQSSTCCTIRTDLNVTQMKCFRTLAYLIKMLQYGTLQDTRGQSLVGACVALHRKGARVDPAFIHRAIHMFPEEARVVDADGNTPLHIEASIPVEKMSLLDADTHGSTTTAVCHQRLSVLRKLLEIYPQAAQLRNAAGSFPLNLMIQNGRPWDASFALVIRTYPQALHWVENLEVHCLPGLLARVSNHCGADTLFCLLRTRPVFLVGR